MHMVHDAMEEALRRLGRPVRIALACLPVTRRMLKRAAFVRHGAYVELFHVGRIEDHARHRRYVDAFYGADQ